ncbi:hypothetical protein AAMO2058_001268700 [Amorphochlora amoebiformis]
MEHIVLTLLWGLSVLIGRILPCIYGYQSVQSGTSKSQRHWLAFWIMTSLFVIPEYFPIVQLGVSYYLLKSIFLLALIYPTPQGSTWMFESTLRRTLLANEERIDAFLDTISNATSRWVYMALDIIMDHIRMKGTDLASLGLELIAKRRPISDEKKNQRMFQPLDDTKNRRIF